MAIAEGHKKNIASRQLHCISSSTDEFVLLNSSNGVTMVYVERLFLLFLFILHFIILILLYYMTCHLPLRKILCIWCIL
jgi:hypothetical protein